MQCPEAVAERISIMSENNRPTVEWIPAKLIKVTEQKVSIRLAKLFNLLLKWCESDIRHLSF